MLDFFEFPCISFARMRYRRAMNFWDERFSGDTFKYGTEPNAFLVEQASRLAEPSDVLVPGDGECRNGVWLAQQGHRVTSVDSSIVGLEKGRALAEARHVPFQTVLADLADWVPVPSSLDAVVLIYVHLPDTIRMKVHRALAEGLRPGGVLVLEGFHPDQIQFDSGGPKDVSMLMTPEQLTQDFAGVLEPEMAWTGAVNLAEGPGHQGEARVTRWVGRRVAA